MSGFFELPPPPADPVPGYTVTFQPDWAGPRRGTVPGVAPVERALAATDEVVVHISCFWVYADGLEFNVFADLRDDLSELDPFRMSYRATREEDGLSESLLIGFEDAQGRRATCLERGLGEPEVGDSPAPRLMSKGGSQSDVRSLRSFWLSPLPPPGRLEIVCEWKAAGIPLTRSQLDCEQILAAASRARTIFGNGTGATR